MQARKLEVWGRRGLWLLIAMMALQGVVARYLLPESLYLHLLGQNFHDYVPQEVRIRHELPLVEAVHRLPGLLMMVFGMLQFDASLRRRHPRLHRLSGICFLVMLLFGIVTGLVFAWRMPFSGIQESVLMTVVAGFFLLQIAQGWRHARAGRHAAHREWAIRLFGLSFFVAVQRCYGTPMFLLTDWPQREAFMLSTTLAVATVAITAEWWIQRTRMRLPSAASTLPTPNRLNPVV